MCVGGVFMMELRSSRKIQIMNFKRMNKEDKRFWCCVGGVCVGMDGGMEDSC